LREVSHESFVFTSSAVSFERSLARKLRFHIFTHHFCWDNMRKLKMVQTNSEELGWVEKRRDDAKRNETRWDDVETFEKARHEMKWDEVRLDETRCEMWDEKRREWIRWNEMKLDEVKWGEKKSNLEKRWHQNDTSRACCCDAQKAWPHPIGTVFAPLYSL